MNAVKKLEIIGQCASIKQFESVEKMIQESNVETSLLSEIQISELELVCMVFTDQDESVYD